MQTAKKAISVLGKTIPQTIRNNSDKVVPKQIPTAKEVIKTTNQKSSGKQSQLIETANSLKQNTKKEKDLSQRSQSAMDGKDQIAEQGQHIDILQYPEEEEEEDLKSENSSEKMQLEEQKSSHEPQQKRKSIETDQEKEAQIKEAKLYKTKKNDGDEEQPTLEADTSNSEQLIPAKKLSNEAENENNNDKQKPQNIKEDEHKIEVEIQKKKEFEPQQEQLNPILKQTAEDAIHEVYGSCASKPLARKTFPNVLFFANELKSNFGQSHLIQDILKKRGNYNILELDHAYIQWIFPNKYQSMFNNKSQALSDKEIDIFIRNEDLSKLFIECYEMMLDFYGMRLVDKRTGEIDRSVKVSPNDYKTRYREAVCGHNCLRIRRILTSLNNLGFRRYAIELVEFLEREITKGDRPLKGRLLNLNKDWKQYGTCETPAEIKQLEEVTFQKMEQLERKNILLVHYDEEEMKNGTNKSKKNEEKLLKGKEPTGIKKIFCSLFGGK